MSELHYRSIITSGNGELTNTYAFEVKARVMIQEATLLGKRNHNEGGILGQEDAENSFLLDATEEKTKNSDQPCVGSSSGGYSAPSRRSEQLREADKFIEHGASVFSEFFLCATLIYPPVYLPTILTLPPPSIPTSWLCFCFPYLCLPPWTRFTQPSPRINSPQCCLTP